MLVSFVAGHNDAGKAKMVTDLTNSVKPLQTYLNENAGRLRFMALLSPT
jgi:hypothetical protein